MSHICFRDKGGAHLAIPRERFTLSIPRETGDGCAWASGDDGEWKIARGDACEILARLEEKGEAHERRS